MVYVLCVEIYRQSIIHCVDVHKMIPLTEAKIYTYKARRRKEPYRQLGQITFILYFAKLLKRTINRYAHELSCDEAKKNVYIENAHTHTRV